MKRKFFPEGGQALILIAFAAFALFAIAGLGIDGSAKFSDRRHAQNAADTAALAGAYALGNDDSYWTTIARDMASENGYDGNLLTNQVWVYQCNDPNRTNAPADLNCGQYEDRSEYLEVIILSRVTTYFVRVLGIRESTNIVHSVALARPSQSLLGGAAVVALDPNPTCGGGNGGGSVNVGGSGIINLTGGGIFVNASSSCGYVQQSCNVTLTTSPSEIGVNSAGGSINIKDQTTNQNCNTEGVPTDTTKQQVVIPDDLYWPSRPSVCNTHSPLGSYTHAGRNYTLYPGYYSGNFPPNAVTNSNNRITLSPGVYCIDGSANQGISWNNGSYESLSGNGVTFYIITGGGFSMSGGAVNLTAPTSNNNPYKGYLIILEGNQNSHPSCTINGNSSSTIEGTIFAPYCDITINGSSGTDTFGAQIIGWDVKINGGTLIDFTYDPGKTVQEKTKVGLMK